MASRVKKIKIDVDKKVGVDEGAQSSKPGTLLEKHFLFFIMVTAAEFVVTESWLFIYGKTVCNDDAYKRGDMAKLVNALVAGAFCMNIVLNGIRLNSGVIFSRHHNIKATFYAVLCVNSIAAYSALTTLFHPNGTCKDYFGVQMNAETYPEWLASVPLLGFMAISVDSKFKFSFNDQLFIASLFLCIFFGFALVFPIFQTMISSWVLMFLSCFFFVLFLYLADKMVWEAYDVLSDNPFLPANSFKVHLATRKILLVRFLTVLFPVFPLIYLLGLLKWIDGNMVDAALMAASAFSKMIFASLCTDAKLEITHPSVYAQDIKEKLNKDRRIFLRYIFHEIRAPLNSMTLGIQYLFDFISELGATPAKLMELSNMMGGAFNNQSSGNSVMSENDNQSIASIFTTSANPDVPSVNETLTMMNEATSYMDNVLNDVFAIHKIEEGSLKLVRKPFTLDSLVTLASEPLEQIIGTKKIRFEVKTDYAVPMYVKGDKYQLSHIISKVLSNAVKYSPKEGKVVLSLSSPRDTYSSNIEDYDADDETITELKDVPMRDYVIEVIDSGPGMSKEVIDSIFSPYDKTRPHGDLSIGKGSGLGLTVCKEIIEMHGGSLSCISRLGRGTTFTITVPLEVTPKFKEDTDLISENDPLTLSGQESVFSQNLSLHSSTQQPVFIPGQSFDPKSTWNCISLQQKIYRFSVNKRTDRHGDNMSQMTSSLISAERPTFHPQTQTISSSLSQAPSVQPSSSTQLRLAPVEIIVSKHKMPENTTTSSSSSSTSVSQLLPHPVPAPAKTSKTPRARVKKNAKEDDTSNENENVTSTVQEVTKPKRRRSIKKSKTLNDSEAKSADLELI